MIDHGFPLQTLAVYDTAFDTCYEAERAAQNQAWADYVDTGMVEEISIKSCEQSEVLLASNQNQ